MIYRILLSYLLKFKWKDFVISRQLLLMVLFSFIAKFGYNARCHWLKERLS